MARLRPSGGAKGVMPSSARAPARAPKSNRVVVMYRSLIRSPIASRMLRPTQLCIHEARQLGDRTRIGPRQGFRGVQNVLCLQNLRAPLVGGKRRSRRRVERGGIDAGWKQGAARRDDGGGQYVVRLVHRRPSSVWSKGSPNWKPQRCKGGALPGPRRRAGTRPPGDQENPCHRNPLVCCWSKTTWVMRAFYEGLLQAFLSSSENDPRPAPQRGPGISLGRDVQRGSARPWAAG